MHSDLIGVERPRISVITPSLNHARFLRDTIESVASQSFRHFEHIVIDGASIDETISVLKDYPHIRWVSEKDEDVVDAYRKGFAMARGDYIIQCCVSDGFLDRQWFSKCVSILDADQEVSLVWGFPQYMSEDGALLNVSYQEFFSDPPPQKQEFLAYWLATGFCFPEGNYCVRREIIAKLFPGPQTEEYFRIQSHLGFMYRFMTEGYCPLFIPSVANYGRIHKGQRGQRLWDIERPAYRMYRKRIRDYRRAVLAGRTVQEFRDARSTIFDRISRSSLPRLRRQIWRERVFRSPLVRLNAYTVMQKCFARLRGRRR